MNLWVLYGMATGLAGCLAFGAWLWHLRLKNAGVIDVVWGLNLALMAVVYAVFGSGWSLRRGLIASLVVLSGLRLSWHIARRCLGHPEEGRYQVLRQTWGKNVGFKFLVFFMFQAMLASMLSLPFLVSCANPATSLSPFEIGALLLFALGFLGESLADAQLKAFKAEPSHRGKTCQSGLWNYSRHPNYFFEWVMWMSYWIYACASPWGWTTFFPPALMLYFLVEVTGIKATEEQCLRSRGEEYRRYQRNTSAFFLWFKRSR